MGCEKFQITPGILLELVVHGGDQLFFVLMKHRPPLLFRLQVDEVFGVEEAGGVGAVVGPPDLARHLRDFRKRSEHDAGLIRDAHAFGGSGAGRERAAHPDGAFVEMGQEFGSDAVRASTMRRPERATADGRR